MNPTPHPYLRVTWTSVPWVTWEAVTGVEGTLCRVLIQYTLANGTLVYPKPGRMYHAEGCRAL